MLEALVGNKNIERILFFMIVNEKCYATQLHKQLCIPLSPIQKALERLEKGGIIVSNSEGKVKVFQFHNQYPFLNQLEALLREAYLQLPLKEKKQYCQATSNRQNHLIESLWDQLKEIKRVSFIARSLKDNSLMGKGEGKVKVEYQGKGEIIFHEEGIVTGRDGSGFNFKNVFRWNYHRFDGMLSLEHLRLGLGNPVFLFHLIPKGSHLLESLHPHLCGKDTYFGWLRIYKGKITLLWRIMGPKKNEEIEYSYFV